MLADRSLGQNTRALYDEILDDDTFRIFVDEAVKSEVLDPRDTYGTQTARLNKPKDLVITTFNTEAGSTLDHLGSPLLSTGFGKKDFTIIYSALRNNTPLVTSNPSMPMQIFNKLPFRNLFKDAHILIPQTSITTPKSVCKVAEAQKQGMKFIIFKDLNNFKKNTNHASRISNEQHSCQ